MRRVVHPRTGSISRLAGTHVDDRQLALAPTGPHIEPYGLRDADSNAPHDARSDSLPPGRGAIDRRRYPEPRRSRWPQPCAVDDDRVVVRHKHHLGPRRLDHDVALLDHDALLVVGLQVACRLRLGAQPLDSVHHGLGVAQKGVAELLRPLELVIHHRQHGRKLRERSDARLPALRLDRSPQGLAFQTRVALHEAGGLHHLERVGRRRQHLRQQRVGVQGHRRKQLIELLLRVDHRCIGGVLCQHMPRQTAERQRNDHQRNGPLPSEAVFHV